MHLVMLGLFLSLVIRLKTWQLGSEDESKPLIRSNARVFTAWFVVGMVPGVY